MNILVVDDSEFSRSVLMKMLGGLPVEILVASSGQEALSIAEKTNNLAVILLDVHMPGLNGFETAERLRNKPECSSIPIIFVTAETQEAKHVFRGYESGAVDFLAKPFPEQVLRSKVRVFLQLAEQKLALEGKKDELLKSHQELSLGKIELERSNRALREFAHAAAHDLKAPLRHLRAWVGFLEEDYSAALAPEALRMLQQINKSALRMHKLVEHLLAFAVVGASKPSMYEVSLNTVIRDVMEDLSEIAIESGAELQIVDLPAVQGDPILLQQLFQNLMGNALKYHQPDVPPRVQITTERVEGSRHVRISVVDEGIGFESDRAEQIFEPFRRLVSENDFEGSGIGMATARKIVELHGGEIYATGEEGKGAAFHFTLPLAS